MDVSGLLAAQRSAGQGDIPWPARNKKNVWKQITRYIRYVIIITDNFLVYLKAVMRQTRQIFYRRLYCPKQ